jgi:multicomponent Na+:H+ antiporter subunit B
VIARKTLGLVIASIILYGFYVILHGHISPGGGFAGGTIIGLGIVLMLVIFGDEMNKQRARRPIDIAILLLPLGAIAETLKLFKAKTCVPSADPVGLFSGGAINIVNFGIGLLVASTILTIYYIEERG